MTGGRLKDLCINNACTTVLADKVYTGKQLSQEMEEHRIQLMPLNPSNVKDNWPTNVRQLIFRLRRRSENVFSQLTEQLNAERARAKSFNGFYARLENKILAHNIRMAINILFHDPLDIGKFKSLVF